MIQQMNKQFKWYEDYISELQAPQYQQMDKRLSKNGFKKHY